MKQEGKVLYMATGGDVSIFLKERFDNGDTVDMVVRTSPFHDHHLTGIGAANWIIIWHSQKDKKKSWLFLRQAVNALLSLTTQIKKSIMSFLYPANPT